MLRYLQLKLKNIAYRATGCRGRQAALICERLHKKLVCIKQVAVYLAIMILHTPDAEPEPPSQLLLHLDIDERLNTSAFCSMSDLSTMTERICAAIITHAPQAEGEAGLRLSDDEEIQQLNAQFRGKNKPTNVLSFPLDAEMADGTLYLGDIIISLPTVAREAAEQGKPPLHHLQHMMVHGMLHLLGHDHETDGEATTMETLETAILASMNIENPYA